MSFILSDNKLLCFRGKLRLVNAGLNTINSYFSLYLSLNDRKINLRNKLKELFPDGVNLILL